MYVVAWMGTASIRIYRFPNDYGASVISAPKRLKFAKPGFRIFVLHYDSPAPDHSYCIEKETKITDDFVEASDWTAVEGCLRSIFELSQSEGCTKHCDCEEERSS